jgi:ketosteroid isomerase-like protein
VTLSEATHARLDDLFKAVDAKDTERFLDFLTDEASFRFGSAPPAQGREAIRIAVNGFFSTIAGCRHVLARIVAEDDVIICEGEVTYTRHDASEVTLPFANVFELVGELISAYKIYADAGPLYEQ